jgi:DNA replication protein DnaC
MTNIAPDPAEFLTARLDSYFHAKWSDEHPNGVPSFREWFAQMGITSAEAAEARVRADQRSRLRDQAGARLAGMIPARYANSQLDDPQILAWVTAAMGDPWNLTPIHDGRPDGDNLYGTMGPSLLILGAVGTGKTYQAYGLVKWLFEQDLFRTIEITSAVEWYAALRPRSGVDSEAVFERYANTDLLMIDDLGTGKNSEWCEEQNFRLVDYRYNRQLTTIFTSNTPPRELGERLGARTASRLTQMCDHVVIKGQDRRRAA